MPTAVPATVPPSRLCTKFVPPIVFAKEVLGTISPLRLELGMKYPVQGNFRVFYIGTLMSQCTRATS